jgi:hypothetical protein
VRLTSAVLLASLLGGCVTEHHIFVQGASLQQTSGDLQAKGSADVAVDEVRHGFVGDDSVTPRIERVAIDQPVTDRLGRTRWVRDLLRGCDATDGAASVDCELVQPGAAYELRRYDTHDPVLFTQIATTGLVVGGLGAAAVCLGACEDDSRWRTASAWTLGVTGAAIVGLLVWAILDCRGRWGQAGCRD